jgi:hypothetical protein
MEHMELDHKKRRSRKYGQYGRNINMKYFALNLMNVMDQEKIFQKRRDSNDMEARRILVKL